MTRVAFYGGAFDPPHAAHLFAVTWLLGRTDLDEVWVAPTADHVFGKEMAPYAERVAMLRAALAPFAPDRVKICEIEAEREGPSRSYDTLELLEARHPGHAFTLVIGADNLAESHRWYRFDDLVARWRVIALGRPGHERALAEVDRAWCDPGPTLPDVSSTDIRAALRGEAAEANLRWLPQAIAEDARRLYGRSAPVDAPSVWIFGAGRAGRALSAALRAVGVTVHGVWNRGQREGATVHGALPSTLTQAEVWLLCVSDPALPALAERLAPHARPGIVALHTAGRLGAEALGALAEAGAETGSLHPLQSLRGEHDTLRGAWCAVEGSAAARAAARRLIEALGARPIEVPMGQKATWHAAAVQAGNFLTTLGAGGVELLGAIGLDEATARACLVPLMRGTLDHLARSPAAEALTGPFARVDLDAVSAHLDAVARHAPAQLPAWRALARLTAALSGWDAGARAALEALLAD